MVIVDTLEQMLASQKALSEARYIACDLEADGLDTKTADIQGIGYGTKEEQFFIPFPTTIPHDEIRTFLLILFTKEVIFHNAKYDMKLLKHKGFPVPKHFHDTMIMSWLVDENSQHGLKPLTASILGRTPKKFNQLTTEINLFTSAEDIMRELAEYCCEDIRNTYELFEYFYPLLDKEGVKIDYERVELKLIPVLMDMEMRGIQVDVSMLQEKNILAKKELARLEQEICNKIREVSSNHTTVNIRSSKQIEMILFDILKYPEIKKTESNKRSTDNEVLETLVKKLKLTDDDVVPMLLKFRDLDKVNGTYFEALVEQAGLENVIRANFLQHGTRTGRLASNDPNMQNIPTRHDEWDVRQAFIPREGYKFIIADYSQIELRMLAHFSQDKHMVDTFLKGGDIHATTMRLAGIKERRIAKNVNFGIVYGVGPRTLSQMINKKEDEAKRYIDRFFAGYPQIRKFMYQVQQQTFRTGYVTMITGRRRHFQEIADRRWYTTIQRQSINTKIQGSAADLIKIAMIRLRPLLKKYDAHILLQIHDEIIVEAPHIHLEEVKQVIRTTMENALTLRVPLAVSMVEGDKWIKG